MSHLTQGNWKAHRRFMASGTHWSVIDKQNRSIANVNGIESADEEQLRLNTSLLAAAPDLLKFAEHFLAEIEAGNITNSHRAARSNYNARDILTLIAKAAVTKAKGEEL